MQSNESDERVGRSRKRVLVVAKGFDVSVPEGCTLRKRVLRVESMLRNHFSSCGKIKSVCIRDASYSSTIKRFVCSLGKHDFSSCGEVLEVDLYPNKNSPYSNLKFVVENRSSSLWCMLL